jgi:hypothetical protein
MFSRRLKILMTPHDFLWRLLVGLEESPLLPLPPDTSLVVAAVNPVWQGVDHVLHSHEFPEVPLTETLPRIKWAYPRSTGETPAGDDRVRLYAFDPRTALNLFRGPFRLRGEFPADARAVRASYSGEYFGLCVVLSHPTFDPVPAGALMPTAGIVYAENTW